MREIALYGLILYWIKGGKTIEESRAQAYKEPTITPGVISTIKSKKAFITHITKREYFLLVLLTLIFLLFFSIFFDFEKLKNKRIKKAITPRISTGIEPVLVCPICLSPNIFNEQIFNPEYRYKCLRK